MQQSIIAFFRKIIASIIAMLVSLGLTCGSGEVVDSIVRGEENTITAYDVANSDYQLSIDASNEVHEISELLYGVFFEDINFAADGGLYAEKVINRSFEYGELAEGDELHGWSGVGDAKYSVTVNDAEGGLNANNTNYLVIENSSGVPAGVQNKGFLDGMAIEKDANYYFSVYAKGIDGYSGAVTVNLVANGEVAATGTIDSITSEWAQYELTLVSTVTATQNVYLQLTIDDGKAAFDMVSLFPDTYKNHGLRIDLAEKVAELEPKFLRFPGGCVIEGWNAETAYNWKDSIGVGEDGLPLNSTANTVMLQHVTTA